jgi:hypothetical protein
MSPSPPLDFPSRLCYHSTGRRKTGSTASPARSTGTTGNGKRHSMMQRPLKKRKLAKYTRPAFTIVSRRSLRSLNVVTHFREVKPQSIIQLDHSLHRVHPDEFPKLRVSAWFGIHRLDSNPITGSQGSHAQPVPLVYTYFG